MHRVALNAFALSLLLAGCVTTDSGHRSSPSSVAPAVSAELAGVKAQWRKSGVTPGWTSRKREVNGVKQWAMFDSDNRKQLSPWSERDIFRAILAASGDVYIRQPSNMNKPWENRWFHLKPDQTFEPSFDWGENEPEAIRTEQGIRYILKHDSTLQLVGPDANPRPDDPKITGADSYKLWGPRFILFGKGERFYDYGPLRLTSKSPQGLATTDFRVIVTPDRFKAFDYLDQPVLVARRNDDGSSQLYSIYGLLLAHRHWTKLEPIHGDLSHDRGLVARDTNGRSAVLLMDGTVLLDNLEQAEVVTMVTGVSADTPLYKDRVAVRIKDATGEWGMLYPRQNFKLLGRDKDPKVAFDLGSAAWRDMALGELNAINQRAVAAIEQNLAVRKREAAQAEAERARLARLDQDFDAAVAKGDRKEAYRLGMQLHNDKFARFVDKDPEATQEQLYAAASSTSGSLYDRLTRRYLAVPKQTFLGGNYAVSPPASVPSYQSIGSYSQMNWTQFNMQVQHATDSAIRDMNRRIDNAGR